MDTFEGYCKIGKERFEVYYACGSEILAKETLVSLQEAEFSVRDFTQKDKGFSKVTVAIAPVRKEFDRLVKDCLGVEIESPSNPARIAQVQGNIMVLLTPDAYEKESTFAFSPENYKRLLAHELIHIAEEYLSPDIENSPRWWGEGLAVYFSSQWEHEDEFNSVAIKGISSNSIPRLAEIQTDTRLAYDWGWTVVWFIDKIFGRERIVQIVRQCSDGNVLACLGQSDLFEDNWKGWLKANNLQFMRI